MRRGGFVLVRLVCAAVLVTLAGCADDRPREPALPEVDFSADGEVVIGENDASCTGAEHGPCGFPAGSVLEVRNDDLRDRRVQGGTVFDSGTMRPGETMTLVLREPGDVEVRDHATGEILVTIVVTEREPAEQQPG